MSDRLAIFALVVMPENRRAVVIASNAAEARRLTGWPDALDAQVSTLGYAIKQTPRTIVVEIPA